MLTLALVLTGCLALVAGCKDEAKTGTGGTTPGTNATGGTRGGSGGTPGASTPAGTPTKEAAVKTLQDAAAALEGKDYDKALLYIHVPPNRTPEQFKTAGPGLIEKQEISTKGVEILAAQGKWGKLDEVFPKERAQSMAERAGLPLDECYGLTHGDAQAGFHWNGQQFKIMHLDDVGKLTE
jgi:hypothetical protein